MPNAFTHYWIEKQNTDIQGEQLQHVASDEFRDRGVSPGDSIFCVSQHGGKLFLIARMIVDEITDADGAAKFLDKSVGYEDRSDHCVCSSAHGSPILFDRELPSDVARQLRFETSAGEVTEISFAPDSTAEQQSLRKLQRLTPDSAALLNQLVELTPDSQNAPDDVETSHEMNKAAARNALDRAKEEYKELGGWSSFKEGGWLFPLIQKSVKAYYEKANAEYFRHKYPGMSDESIAKKLISVAARNALLIGAATGAVVSTDEIVGIFTLGEGGVGIPANIAIATAAIGGEMVFLLRIQLQLVVNLAKLMNCPLDPHDPEDILIILAYALGGGVAEKAGRMGMTIGGKVTEKTIRKYISKEVLEALKALGRKIGLKILQRNIIKYTVPFVSIGIGASWNYATTKSVGKIALRHFRERVKP